MSQALVGQQNHRIIVVPAASEGLESGTHESDSQGPDSDSDSWDSVTGNPAVLATCTFVGTSGVAVIAAPGLVSVPVLSALGFGTGGVKMGKWRHVTELSSRRTPRSVPPYS